MNVSKRITPDRNAAALLGEGEAALWLTESLIIALLEAGLLSRDGILEAIESVVAAKNVEAEQGNHPEVARAAAAMLATVAASLGATTVPAASEAAPGRGGPGST